MLYLALGKNLVQRREEKEKRKGNVKEGRMVGERKKRN